MSEFNLKSFIELSCGDWSAAVVPEVGMNLVSLRCKGEKILRECSSLDILKANPVIYGNPLQLPANRTDHGRFTFDGTEYSLPLTEPARDNSIHGELHSAAFTVTSADSRSIKGRYENHGEIFPFPFASEVSICLCDDGCREDITITNIGETDMPLAFGLHTLFHEQDSFSVPLGKLCEVNERYIPTGVRSELDDIQKSYVTGAVSRGVNVGGFYTSSGSTVRVGRYYLTVSDSFTNWVLWNKGGSDGFIAIEPQQGEVNALNSKTGLIRLRPGAHECFSLHFHL